MASFLRRLSRAIPAVARLRSGFPQPCLHQGMSTFPFGKRGDTRTLTPEQLELLKRLKVEFVLDERKKYLIEYNPEVEKIIEAAGKTDVGAGDDESPPWSLVLKIFFLSLSTHPRAPLFVLPPVLLLLLVLYVVVAVYVSRFF